MKQTEKVSIGGYPFSIEEDAFGQLNNYLETLKANYCNDDYANEIIHDIEERIAELLIEKGGRECVVNYHMVDLVISIIGTPTDIANDTDINKDADVSNDSDIDKDADKQGNSHNFPKKKLFRNPDNKILGGVCSGIAAYFKADEPLVRIACIGAIILSGFMLTGFGGYELIGGIVLSSLCFAGLYSVLWLIIPAAKTIEQKCQMNNSPINLGDFEKKFENRTADFANEVKNSKIVHSIKRIISIPTGSILIFFGIAGMICCFMYDLMPGLCDKMGPHDQTINTLITGRMFWMLLGADVAILSILTIYNGMLLLFNLKAPKWRPGLILFIIFLILLIITAVYTIRILLITEMQI